MNALFSTRTFLIPFLVLGLAVLPACDGDDGASIDGDVSMSVDGPEGTSVGLSIEYYDDQGVEGTGELVTLDGSEVTRDLEDGHAGYRVTASPNPTTASLTLQLLNDGDVVKEDTEAQREGGVTTFVVEAGDVQDLSDRR